MVNSKNKQVHGFALNPFTTKILYGLINIDACYIAYGKKSILGYVENYLYYEQPKYILGLGSYTGIDQNKIRIEKICVNKFRNEPIEDVEINRMEIKPFLRSSENSKYANALGNSFCNYASWKIMRAIQKGEISAEYTFLHIPRKMRCDFAIREVDRMLAEFKI